jgi:hypothetical protein
LQLNTKQWSLDFLSNLWGGFLLSTVQTLGLL